jgi:tetratricopeptide (TPR) repeat protein
MTAKPAPELRALPHAVFLERMAGAPTASSSEARLGRAAFVALRLVDLLGHDREALHAGAFHYQHVATERACRDLPADRTETTHLVGLVQSAADAFQADANSLALPALIAYAHYLEDEMRLEQALDVLETMRHIGGDELSSPDAIGLRLRTARVLRKLNQFDAAERSYDEAGALAGARGDTHSELLSRIGRVRVTLGRGRLAEAECSLRDVLADANRLSDADAQARAYHDIAVVLRIRGQPAEAIPHIWRAFQLYQDELSRGRALADLGGVLLMVGDVDGAECALVEAVRIGGEQDYATNALIELMHCASYRRDRIGFERWLERCEARREHMPPNILVDFTLRMGIGRARFGQIERAEALLTVALRSAGLANLHEFVFRIERIKNGLRDCSDSLEARSEVSAAVELRSDAVREVSEELAHLGV